MRVIANRIATERNSMTGSSTDKIREAFEEYTEAQNRFIDKLKGILIPDPEAGITWVSTRQASERTGAELRNIQNWITSNKVRSRRSGHCYEVVLEDVMTKHLSRMKA